MMKKTGKLFVSMASLGMALNNVAYAATEVTTESEGGSTTKYLFMGVAALVIVLLLFLGYKMDTKGDDKPVKKVSNKSEKVKKKISEKAEAIKENSGNYEADEEAYEEDGEIFDNEDLNDSVEYKEDDEGSLFAASEDEDSEVASEVAPEPVKKAEKSSEEFDTSVIDGLDDEEETTPKASFDETMLFNSDEFSATGSSLEDEIDNLDNFETPSAVEIENTEVEPEEKDVVEATEIEAGESNDFVNELKNFEEPESAFEGFSVAPKKEERLEDIIEEKAKGAKNTEETEIEEVAEPEEIEETPAFMDNDFLSQMEANLKKSHNDRVAKKETKTTTKKTTKKKEG